MKLQKNFILALIFFKYVAVNGQLFTPLNLGIEKCELKESHHQPQMHIEGDILYVCTNQGLYSRDLSNREGKWQLAGFKDIPLQDFVRSGNDMMALCNSNSSCLLLSHDGGENFKDITPDLFKGNKNDGKTLISLAQNPVDSNTLLVLSNPTGILQTSDFGQTWNQITSMIPQHIGYHPLNPDIICIGGKTLFYAPCIYISYDCGQTWSYLMPENHGDNCVNRISFDPVNPDRWIAGGQGVIYSSADNGFTWNTHYFEGDVRGDVDWRLAAYDNENSDIVYMAGCSQDKTEVICSIDGGNTWSMPQTISMKTSSSEMIYDLEQYDGKLLFFTESDIYEVSKTELLAQSTSIRNISTLTNIESIGIYDLLGRKQRIRPSEGIYILQGQKVLVK